jgi:hypothetical protein
VFTRKGYFGKDIYFNSNKNVFFTEIKYYNRRGLKFRIQLFNLNSKIIERLAKGRKGLFQNKIDRIKKKYKRALKRTRLNKRFVIPPPEDNSIISCIMVQNYSS